MKTSENLKISMEEERDRRLRLIYNVKKQNGAEETICTEKLQN